MTSVPTSGRLRASFIVASSVGLLLFAWLIPLRHIPGATLGSYVVEMAGGYYTFCEGWIILLACAALCWSHCKACDRNDTTQPGHWIWLAGIIGCLLLFLVCMRGRETLFALGMLPPLLLCGSCWVAGWRMGRGFAVPLLLLYAFSVSVQNWHGLLQHHSDLTFRRWFGEDLEIWRQTATEWQLYRFMPRSGTAIVLTVSLCWLARRHWRRVLVLVTAGTALVCGHFILFERGC